jgi:hypothetical protein
MITVNTKGQSLVEALIALGAAAVVVSAMAVAAITAVNNADFSKYQNLATHYAQQGIEVIRQKSQLDWIYFSTSSGTFCLNQDSEFFLPSIGLPLPCNKNINLNGKAFFVRQVVLTPAGSPCDNGAHVAVAVKWTDGKCASGSFCHKVNLESCISNIDAVPTIIK